MVAGIGLIAASSIINSVLFGSGSAAAAGASAAATGGSAAAAGGWLAGVGATVSGIIAPAALGALAVGGLVNLSTLGASDAPELFVVSAVIAFVACMRDVDANFYDKAGPKLRVLLRSAKSTIPNNKKVDREKFQTIVDAIAAPTVGPNQLPMPLAPAKSGNVLFGKSDAGNIPGATLISPDTIVIAGDEHGLFIRKTSEYDEAMIRNDGDVSGTPIVLENIVDAFDTVRKRTLRQEEAGACTDDDSCTRLPWKQDEDASMAGHTLMALHQNGVYIIPYGADIVVRTSSDQLTLSLTQYDHRMPVLELKRMDPPEFSFTWKDVESAWTSPRV